jgi:hypothetical protein
VDIRVECVTPDVLSGKKRVWFGGIFHLIGIPGEGLFVSKLRKAESAQHRTQWNRTGGYASHALRQSGIFLGVRFFPVRQRVLAHPPATNAHRWAVSKKFIFRKKSHAIQKRSHNKKRLA